jgi:hypothetical protein
MYGKPPISPVAPTIIKVIDMRKRTTTDDIRSMINCCKLKPNDIVE